MSLLSLYNFVECHSQPASCTCEVYITFYSQLAQAAQVKCVSSIVSTWSLYVTTLVHVL